MSSAPSISQAAAPMAAEPSKVPPLPWEKHERKPLPGTQLVFLQTSDGEIVELPPELLELSTTCKNLLRAKGKVSSFQNSLGGTFSVEDNHIILKKEGRFLATLLKDSPAEAQILLHDVKAATLRRVLEYCWFDLHPEDKDGERERKTWKQNFVNVEQAQLCDLASVRSAFFISRFPTPTIFHFLYSIQYHYFRTFL